MKVLFCSLEHEYGNPQRGPSFEYQNFFLTLKNMPGVVAEFFPLDRALQPNRRDELNNQLISQVQERGYDLLFCFLFTEELKKTTVDFITKHTRTKTFNWFGDDHWRFPIFSRQWAPIFSLVSTTDSSAYTAYRRAGINNVIKTQWAANHYLYRPQDPARNNGIYGVTFLGQNYGIRRRYVHNLQSRGVAVQAYGWGWSNGGVSEQQKLNIFSYSRINLNFTETPDHGALNKLKLLTRLFLKKELGRYRLNKDNPWSTMQSIIGTQRLTIKGRNFEVPACRGFLLTGRSHEDLSEYYQEGREIAVFNNQAELLEKCFYYLEHDDERIAIAKAGYERTIKEHTYEKRFYDIFSKIIS